MLGNYEEFKKNIYVMTSIDLSKYKETQMKRRINALIGKHNISSYSEYIKLLKTNTQMYQEFINYITINVSEFFRNKEQWNLLREDILPKILKTKPGLITIWSSACSTGEEPYSLAMTISKLSSLNRVKIIASDIDDGVLKKAQAGVYTKKEVAGIPNDLLQEFFSTDSKNNYVVNNKLKNIITFKKHNLLKDIYPTNLDLILCRNVLIYFTEDAKVDIYKKFHNSLTNSGILFVGNTEQIIQSSKLGFEAYKSFFYKKI